MTQPNDQQPVVYEKFVDSLKKAGVKIDEPVQTTTPVEDSGLARTQSCCPGQKCEKEAKAIPIPFGEKIPGSNMIYNTATREWEKMNPDVVWDEKTGNFRHISTLKQVEDCCPDGDGYQNIGTKPNG